MTNQKKRSGKDRSARRGHSPAMNAAFELLEARVLLSEDFEKVDVTILAFTAGV